MEEQFEISKKYVDDFTPVIMYLGRNLLIEVYDENSMINQKSIVYRADYSDVANGNFSKYFLVINGFSNFGFINWNYGLFMRMIQFYSKHMLAIYAVNIESVNPRASFFYDFNWYENLPTNGPVVLSEELLFKE